MYFVEDTGSNHRVLRFQLMYSTVDSFLHFLVEYDSNGYFQITDDDNPVRILAKKRQFKFGFSRCTMFRVAALQ
jgi:hypothetical protein